MAKNNKDLKYTSNSFGNRLGSMLKVDLRRMFVSPMLYVCMGIAFAIPVLVLVMTSMVGDEDGGLMFTNAWKIIASESGGMSMDMTSMMDINLMYFMTGIFLCLFVSEDFRSGYVKNLFTVRARKSDYVISKTVSGWIAGALFLTAFFIGAVIGGGAAGLPFTLGAAGIFGLTMCMLSKIFLMGVFVAIFLLMSVIAKSKSWLSILLALFIGMMLFMMIPMMTPIDAGIMNLGLTMAGGVIFAAAIGCGSNLILKKKSLV